MSDTPPTSRLVIRIKLPPRGTPPAPAPSRLNRGALLLTLGGFAVVLLIWLGASMFRSEPAPAPVVAKVAVESVVPEVRKLDAPTSPIDQVVPDISRSARNTISGTIRVTARLTVDKEGKVVDVALVETGPSRYFARLAAEAAEKWTFTPTQSEEPRTVRVWFYFRRSGTSARVDLPISPGH